jgi:hypothetical protein
MYRHMDMRHLGGLSGTLAWQLALHSLRAWGEKERKEGTKEDTPRSTVGRANEPTGEKNKSSDRERRPWSVREERAGARRGASRGSSGCPRVMWTLRSAWDLLRLGRVVRSSTGCTAPLHKSGTAQDARGGGGGGFSKSMHACIQWALPCFRLFEEGALASALASSSPRWPRWPLPLLLSSSPQQASSSSPPPPSSISATSVRPAFLAAETAAVW